MVAFTMLGPVVMAHAVPTLAGFVLPGVVGGNGIKRLLHPYA